MLIKMRRRISSRALAGCGSGAVGAGSRRSVFYGPSSLKTLLIWMVSVSHRYYNHSFLTKWWDHGALQGYYDALL